MTATSRPAVRCPEVFNDNSAFDQLINYTLWFSVPLDFGNSRLFMCQQVIDVPPECLVVTKVSFNSAVDIPFC